MDVIDVNRPRHDLDAPLARPVEKPLKLLTKRRRSQRADIAQHTLSHVHHPTGPDRPAAV
ncbi:MAG: hypothetical protein ACI9WU_004400, partial [Myxococcota bacterium]